MWLAWEGPSKTRQYGPLPVALLSKEMPLHFFPRSSLAYVEKGKITSAEAAWNNERYPESADPAYKLCFGDDSPLDGEFEEVASDVFKSYLEHAEGER